MKNLILSVLLLFSVGCSTFRGPKTHVQLSPAPTAFNECQEKIRALTSLIKSSYGPLKYAESRHQINLDDLSNAAVKRLNTCDLNNSQTWSEIAQLLSQLHDPHVAITFQNIPIKVESQGYWLPINVEPVEDHWIVTKFYQNSDTAQLELGDELLTIDGLPFAKRMAILSKYVTYGRADSDRFLSNFALAPMFYMTELLPSSNNARLIFKKSNGKTFEATLPWHKLSNEEKLPDRSTLKIGYGREKASPVPFFMTDKVFDSYKIRVIQTNPFFAAFYKYQKKRFLLIRLRQFAPETGGDLNKDVAAWKLLLKKWKNKVDGLILDQTGNIGGDAEYILAIYKLFILPKKSEYIFGYAYNVKNSIWQERIDSLTQTLEITGSSGAIIQAKKIKNILMHDQNNGKELSKVLPYIGTNTSGAFSTKMNSYQDFSWEKPILILIDEQARSGGDIFPLLMKNSGRAILFGQPTIGAGGSYIPHRFSPGVTITLTDGLYAALNAHDKYSSYPDGEWVQNTGIEPHVHYSVSLSDMRRGFKNYFKAFNDVAVEWLFLK